MFMSKCKYEDFLNYFDELLIKANVPAMPEDIQRVYDELRKCEIKDKPILTPIGVEILRYARNLEKESFKAKELAEGMGILSRKISGAMNKLCKDGFVDKTDTSPIIYSLSDKGREFNIESFLNLN